LGFSGNDLPTISTHIMLKRKTTVTIESHRGILRLRWNDSSPKRRSLNLHLPDSPATRALAKKKKLWIEQDYQEGEAVYDRTLAKYEESNSDSGSINLTASELFEAFAQHQAKDKSLAQSSIDARYKPVAVALKKVFPDLLVCEIDKEQVEKFVTHCQKTLQTAGVYRERIGIIKSCWEWGAEKYELSINPWVGLNGRMKPIAKQKTSPFTEEEVNRIRMGFRSSQYYSYLADFVDTLFLLGLRPGEACGLQWSSISHDFSKIWIGRSITSGVVRENTKNNKPREITIPPTLAAILKRRKAEVKPRNGTDLLFTTPTGLPIDIRNFRARAWKKTLEAVGVDYKKPYKMRGTAELFAIASGQNYVAVAAAFGHKPEVAHAHYIDVPVFYEFDYQKLPPIIKKSTS
jgi:integrase